MNIMFSFNGVVWLYIFMQLCIHAHLGNEIYPDTSYSHDTWYLKGAVVLVVDAMQLIIVVFMPWDQARWGWWTFKYNVTPFPLCQCLFAPIRRYQYAQQFIRCGFRVYALRRGAVCKIKYIGPCNNGSRMYRNTLFKAAVLLPWDDAVKMPTG